MTHLGGLRDHLSIGAPASFSCPHGHQRVVLTLALVAQLFWGPQLVSGAPLPPNSPVDSCFRGPTCSRGPFALHLGSHLAPVAPWSSNGIVMSPRLLLEFLGAPVALGPHWLFIRAPSRSRGPMSPRGPIGSRSGALARSRGAILGIGCFVRP